MMTFILYLLSFLYVISYFRILENAVPYEVVIGLEVHAQLQTKSKLFCSDSTSFGAEPNTQVSPVTLAHPGTLPVTNKKSIEYAIRMGLACNCEIERHNYFARKNYFYPDLPKGYQVSQHTTPICKGGYVTITVDTTEKQVRLNRIHLEEDAGKSIHDADPDYTCVDYNRAGTPLIEIVTEPDLRSSDEAFAFVTEVRKIVRYLSICDGNMEEGSLRCDANISVRKFGDTVLGTKVEVKNLNSIRNVKRAIEYESQRLISMLEKNEKIIQQTRSFDANTGTTFGTREKEDADDYRYFADPDLSPFNLSDELINDILKSLPELHSARNKKYKDTYNLSGYDASQLTEEKSFADYFEKLVTQTTAYKSAANWMLGPVRSWLNEQHTTIDQFPLDTLKLAALVDLVEEGAISFSTASSRLFPLLLQDPLLEPRKTATDHNLLQQSNSSSLDPIIEAVLQQFADKVIEYKKGKKGLLSLFVGEVMKRSKGKADPKKTNELIIEKLKA